MTVFAKPLICLILLTSAAMAAPPLKVVVLPVSTGGYLPRRAIWQAEFTLRVAEEVKKAKHTVAQPGPLSAVEEGCRDAECANAIAGRAKADAVIAATVMANDKVPPSYHIEVVMFDRAQPGVVRKRDQVCGPCSESNAAEMVTQLSREVIAGKGMPAPQPVVAASPAPSASPEPTAPSVAPDAVVATKSDATTPRTKMIFKVTGFVSAALAVAGLGLMAAGIAKDGDCDNAPLCTYETNGAPAIGVGAAGFAAFGTAAGVLLWKGFQK